MNKPSQRAFTSAMSSKETFTDDVCTVEEPFGKALLEVARERPDIVGLTADLGKYTDIEVFAREFPDRFFQVGMAEQNLVGIAAGLARAGFTPFATTYCVFASRRAYEQIAIDVAFGRANVKIVAGLPGLTTGYGATHQGIDDLALLRAMPNIVVIDPCDATDIQQAVHAMAEYSGPVYMRLRRARVPVVLDPKTYHFQIGAASVLRSGCDIALISTGLMTERALYAALRLEEEDRIQASVLHVPTLKPLDVRSVVEAAGRSAIVVTLENHSLLNGLGTAVAEALQEAGLPVQLCKIGVPHQFIECGATDFLNEKYGLSPAKVLGTCRRLLGIRQAALPKPRGRFSNGRSRTHSRNS